MSAPYRVRSMLRGHAVELGAEIAFVNERTQFSVKIFALDGTELTWTLTPAELQKAVRDLLHNSRVCAPECA